MLPVSLLNIVSDLRNLIGGGIAQETTPPTSSSRCCPAPGA
jgi:hypothetical protein